jgi:hypothetical protein
MTAIRRSAEVEGIAEEFRGCLVANVEVDMSGAKKSAGIDLDFLQGVGDLNAGAIRGLSEFV